ncbi:aspartate carbamoyltransferase [Nitrosomonas marina]|uniref:Aspartate carbamoyltransferase n=1 Tax=Nitrosomonas marina TaxID=917 RepID=A0A1I0BAH0_9PROT|nr:aspartate carbamoyltransferase [Nitrosomonas marina]SET03787.1 aspartate carbamoyltransferase [Nitrosomonas marina]
MVIKTAAKVEHIVQSELKTNLIGLCPEPEGLIKFQPRICLQKLKELTYRSILSADLFDTEMLRELAKVAAYLQLKKISADKVLNDKIMATAFFEASTRTRLSFESAMLRLGGKTLSVAEAALTGEAKGEKLLDIGQMFNSYADIVVIRHTQQKAIQELSEYLRIPIINGGNGSDEHPTQALADWYALLKWKPDLMLGAASEEQLHLGIVGTPGSMRTVKSFLILALLFRHNISQITIVSEMADPLGVEVQSFCDSSPIPIDIKNDLQEVVGELDVIYMNSIAFLGDGYRTLGSRFKLDKESRLKKGAVVLHPLARKDELDVSLDHTRHNLYFNQADGAVFIRQALLLIVFGRLEQVLPDHLIE